MERTVSRGCQEFDDRISHDLYRPSLRKSVLTECALKD